MKKISISNVFLVFLIAIFAFSCKSNNDLETGTEFPEEFLGVWKIDSAEESEFDDDEGIFVHFTADTVTYYGRIGEIENPTCYYTAPLFKIIEFKGAVFTLKNLGLEEESLGELTIKVNKNVMEWIFSKNDIDRWIRTNENVSTFTPACDTAFKSESLTKFKNW